ncbi:MAG: histidine phosphatase family protein [Pseudomonadota bacterium]
MSRLIYLTHPQVVIDPNVPVPEWGLSQVGTSRVALAVSRDAFAGVTHVVSSAEKKAVETAGPIASALGLTVEIREAMHENDRSATGFLPGPEFERVADTFFADPGVSVRGWETARDAQARIVAEVTSVRSANMGTVLCVGHGGVGTLLMCHLANVEISRHFDQGPGGGGSVFCHEPSLPFQTGWTAMENWT